MHLNERIAILLRDTYIVQWDIWKGYEMGGFQSLRIDKRKKCILSYLSECEQSSVEPCGIADTFEPSHDRERRMSRFLIFYREEYTPTLTIP